MLERLDAVEDKQGLLLAHQLGQAQAAVPGRAGLGIGISEPGQGVIEEAVGGGDALLGALAVEGPVEDPPGAAPAVGGHAVEPVADQGGLAHASEGDEGEDVEAGVLPGGVEAGELGFPADQEGAGDGEAAEVEAEASPPVPSPVAHPPDRERGNRPPWRGGESARLLIHVPPLPGGGRCDGRGG